MLPLSSKLASIQHQIEQLTILKKTCMIALSTSSDERIKDLYMQSSMLQDMAINVFNVTNAVVTQQNRIEVLLKHSLPGESIVELEKQLITVIGQIEEFISPFDKWITLFDKNPEIISQISKQLH